MAYLYQATYAFCCTEFNDLKPAECLIRKHLPKLKRVSHHNVYFYVNNNTIAVHDPVLPMYVQMNGRILEEDDQWKALSR